VDILKVCRREFRAVFTYVHSDVETREDTTSATASDRNTGIHKNARDDFASTTDTDVHTKTDNDANGHITPTANSDMDATTNWGDTLITLAADSDSHIAPTADVDADTTATPTNPDTRATPTDTDTTAVSTDTDVSDEQRPDCQGMGPEAGREVASFDGDGILLCAAVTPCESRVWVVVGVGKEISA